MDYQNLFELMQQELGGDDTDESDDGSDEDYQPSEASESTDSDCDLEIESTSSSDNETDVRRQAPDSYCSRDGTQWFKHPMSLARTPQRNIIRQLNGKVTNVNGDFQNPMEAFSLYVCPEIVDDIVKWTNQFAETKLGTQWKQTDGIEVTALIGIWIIAGVTHNNNQSTEMLWSTKYGLSQVRSTMSRERFQHLMTYLRFDDKAERSQRQERDKLAPIRKVFDTFNARLQRFYSPGAYLTVDEQLVPFRGRCGFKQYIPSKPDKYGLKIFWIVDAKTFYPLKAYPYIGKEAGRVQVGLGEKVVMDLARPYARSGRNITMDNYFTSLNLALNLQKDQLTLVGTVRSNRTFVPAEFLPKRAREVESSIFGFRETATMVSYVPKKSKAVILLSTMHSSPDVIVDKNHKPEMILFYNETKGGVDSLDQLAHRYSVKRKTNRWPVVYFMNMVDIAAIAAYIIWLGKNPLWQNKQRTRRRHFLLELGEALTGPNIQRRMASNTREQLRCDFANAGYTAEVRTTSSEASPPAKKRRCHSCPRSSDRKVKTCCTKCMKPTCPQHGRFVCHDCAQ
ncbi:piggyBac transposable element-derived protein 4-like [Haliotis rubra]|uniref:piggyBac transposable element-derived protein 4-like n=1 Tax=Haliotis rubra TaxID=36100 RepID=UPI001EE5B19B|nr:piggyBac transposable element-derived protein 4-like [Haliotis rubra]